MATTPHHDSGSALAAQRLLRSALLAGLLATGTVCFGQSSVDHNPVLLRIMVRKGLITQAEADEVMKSALEEEAAARTAAAPVAAPSPKAGEPAAPAAASSLASQPVVTPAKPICASPLSFRIGGADFTPFGFVDFTTVYRSAADGGDINSVFGSVPYSSMAASKLSETRMSTKNSRLGLRIDSTVDDAKVVGYVETDFFGNPPANLNVTSNSDVLRMRSFFVDARKGAWELMAGQGWSLMTPNRTGTAAYTSDVFYTQADDANYHVGLVWGRAPQVRLTYHASDRWAAALSLENPDQYVGGTTTLPAAFNAADVDTGSSGTATPNVMPDVIGKIAYDGTVADQPVHFEVAGMVRDFKVNTFSAGATPVNADASAVGYAGSVNTFLTVAPHFQLIENVFYSEGGGRYLSTGLGPDFIVQAPNASGVYTLSTVRSYGALGGAEWDVTPTSRLLAYAGVVDFGSDYSRLPTGSYVGLGYPGAPNSQNRRLEEITAGESQLLWKKAGLGDLKLMTQLSYLEREPFIVSGGLADAHLMMIFVDLRYDLP